MGAVRRERGKAESAAHSGEGGGCCMVQYRGEKTHDEGCSKSTCGCSLYWHGGLREGWMRPAAGQWQVQVTRISPER